MKAFCNVMFFFVIKGRSGGEKLKVGLCAHLLEDVIMIVVNITVVGVVCSHTFRIVGGFSVCFDLFLE